MGGRNISSLLRRLEPKAVVPLINASFPAEGPLSKIIKEEGSTSAVAAKLQAEGIQTQVQLPAAPGKSIEVAL